MASGPQPSKPLQWAKSRRIARRHLRAGNCLPGQQEGSGQDAAGASYFDHSELLRNTKLMMATPPDDRAALAKAYGRASQVLTIAIGMVVPLVVGRLADDRWGTKVLFTGLGAAFGLAFGIWHLLKLADPKRHIADKTNSNSDAE